MIIEPKTGRLGAPLAAVLVAAALCLTPLSFGQSDTSIDETPAAEDTGLSDDSGEESLFDETPAAEVADGDDLFGESNGEGLFDAVESDGFEAIVESEANGGFDTATVSEGERVLIQRSTSDAPRSNRRVRRSVVVTGDDFGILDATDDPGTASGVAERPRNRVSSRQATAPVHRDEGNLSDRLDRLERMMELMFRRQGLPSYDEAALGLPVPAQPPRAAVPSASRMQVPVTVPSPPSAPEVSSFDPLLTQNPPAELPATQDGKRQLARRVQQHLRQRQQSMQQMQRQMEQMRRESRNLQRWMERLDGERADGESALDPVPARY